MATRPTTRLRNSQSLSLCLVTSEAKHSRINNGVLLSEKERRQRELERREGREGKGDVKARDVRERGDSVMYCGGERRSVG